MISPASSAGGSELFPADQLVAYPVRDRTVFASTVLLAPANLAWITSFLLLIGVTSYTSALGPMVGFALLTAVVYAAAATLTGQAIAWWLEGVRQRRAGRWTVRVVGGVFVLVGVTLQLTHHLTNLLDQLPTQWVAISAVKGSQGIWWPLWGPLLAGMAAAGLLAFHLGARGCRWTQGQVSDGGLQPESRPVRRRKTAGSDLLALMQIDRASVWRSASLRRGALVMAILPGAIAAITEPSWDSLVLLTGLVAAGSGLLFGVNAFGMDGPGRSRSKGCRCDPSCATGPRPPRSWSSAG